MVRSPPGQGAEFTISLPGLREERAERAPARGDPERQRARERRRAQAEVRLRRRKRGRG